MASKTFYPNTISQTNCSKCRVWNNLNNLKNGSNTFAQCGTTNVTVIAGKNGSYNDPAVLTLTNFKVSIPTGAMITRITVKYAHQKIGYNGVPNIPAPRITLLNVSGKSAIGSTPTTNMSAKSVNFNFKPTTSSITSGKFGVKIDYPANVNNNTGYLRLRYVCVVVTYTEASYSVGITKAENSNKSVDDAIDMNIYINNLNKVNYNPSVTITLPEGVSFNRKVSGDGSFKESDNIIIWNPGLSTSKVASNAIIKLNLDSEGTKTIIIKEALNKESASVTVIVEKKEIQTTTTTEEINEAQSIDTNEDSEPEEIETPTIFENENISFQLRINDEILWTMSPVYDSIKFKAFVNGVDVSEKIYLPEYDVYLPDKSWLKDEIVENIINVTLQPQDNVARHSKVLVQVRAYVYTQEHSGMDILLGGES